MEHVERFVLFLSIACVLFLFIGLYKPWTMLWWEDEQNRIKVLKSYGTLSMLFWGAYFALKYFYHV